MFCFLGEISRSSVIPLVVGLLCFVLTAVFGIYEVSALLNIELTSSCSRN